MKKRKRGRPRTGTDPFVGGRFPTDLLARLKRQARALGRDHSKLIRQYVADGLAVAPSPVATKKRTRGTAIIDPPWPYDRASRHKGMRGHSSRKYRAMSIADLERLPIGQLTSYVFLWTTPPFLETAYRVLRHWGFEPVTCLAWVKTDSVTPGRVPKFKPSYGVGYWFRGGFEPVILAKRKGVPSIRTQWIGLLSPNAEHSRKPDTLYDLIEGAFPGPYFDVFGRRKRKDWIVIGREAPGDGLDVRQVLATKRKKRN